MFNLSPIKILLIVGVALVLLGPDKLPQAARQVGSFWRSLKELQRKVEADVRTALPDLPSSSEIARVVRSPVNLLNTLADRVEPVAESTNESDDVPAMADVDIDRELFEERSSPYSADPSVPNESAPATTSDPGLN